MDESVTDILDAIDASTLSGSDAAQSSENPSASKDNEKTQGQRKWRGLSALKAQASMQDKLLEK